MFLLKNLLVFLILLVNMALFITIYKVINLVDRLEIGIINKEPTYAFHNIVWWNHMLPGYSAVRTCGPYVCNFSGSLEDYTKADAILFYGTKFEEQNFPIPRLPHQLWAMYHDESPINSIFVSNEAFLKHFNITATTSRYSDFPLTRIYMPKLEDLTTRTYMKNLREKEKFGRAPVLFLNSNCKTPTLRENYVRELMQYISVDSFGTCLNNNNLNFSLRYDYYNHLFDVEQLEFLSHYKFILAIENAVCHDYISEKFWRPLVVGAIPIYFGSPTIRDWQPNNKSMIHIRDFENPKSLAEFLHSLNANDSEYMSYLDHKYKKITNLRLLNYIQKNSKVSINEHAFECHVCKSSWEYQRKKVQQANISHYNCPFPPEHPPLMNRSVDGNPWEQIMLQGQCQAKAYDELFNRNVCFRDYELYERMNNCN